jgi:hypothetical protein
VRKDLTIESGVQFYWSRSRLSLGFCGRHKTVLEGICRGEVILAQIRV